MRINWFSPLLPERTDIAHYTARIAPALMSAFDVTFWTDLSYYTSAMPETAKICRFDADRVHNRATYANFLNAINIYHFGNDARYHAGIFRIARQFPGVAIPHDTRLHHFVFELYRSRNWTGYLDLARLIYGPEGLEKAKSIVVSEGRDIDANVEAMPFTEAILDRSACAICHSTEALSDIRHCSNLPAAAIPLPFASLSKSVPAQRRWQPPWRFILFGFINPNRRLESILRALSSERTAMDFTFDIYGTLWDRPKVEAMIVENNLSDKVHLHGFVNEKELDEAISAAHLAFNLRFPTMGEASGGILRSWSHATPAVVTDDGWYATLPETLAPKISSDHEVEDLSKLFRLLQTNPGNLAEMGAAARVYVETVHGPETYVSSLQRLLADSHGTMARLAARRMLEAVGSRARSAADRQLMLGRASEVAARLLSS